MDIWIKTQDWDCEMEHGNEMFAHIRRKLSLKCENQPVINWRFDE